MSKQTTIICDGCGCAVTGVGYSTLLTRLRGKGWVMGEFPLTHPTAFPPAP